MSKLTVIVQRCSHCNVRPANILLTVSYVFESLPPSNTHFSLSFIKTYLTWPIFLLLIFKEQRLVLFDYKIDVQVRNDRHGYCFILGRLPVELVP